VVTVTDAPHVAVPLVQVAVVGAVVIPPVGALVTVALANEPLDSVTVAVQPVHPLNPLKKTVPLPPSVPLMPVTLARDSPETDTGPGILYV